VFCARSSIRVDIKNIGSRPFCITQSLKLAVFAGLVFATDMVIQCWWRSSVSLWISGAIAATLFSLWLVHVAVYGLKAARFLNHKARTETDGLGGDVEARRHFLVTFAKAAAGIAAFTTLSMLSIKSASADMYNCGYGTECNSAYETCCWGVKESGGAYAWCCPKDTQCGRAYGCRSSGN
jgi:hypothetical protein